MVRFFGEYEMEEDLYAMLIFLFRSPETLIRFTRRPQIRESETSEPETSEPETSE